MELVGPVGDGDLPTKDLIGLAQGGDRDALEELFARYLPRVRQIVAVRLGRRLRDFMEVDDVVQDVLLKAFQDFDRFTWRAEGSFCNWLARCVESRICREARYLDAEKRGGARVRRFADHPSGVLSTDIFAGNEPSPSDIARARELEEQLERALLDLTEYQREVFLLRNLCHMGYEEIAQELGKDAANVRRTFSRVLEKLAALINCDRAEGSKGRQ